MIRLIKVGGSNGVAGNATGGPVIISNVHFFISALTNEAKRDSFQISVRVFQL